MSLVGTRPILQDELQKYELHHRARKQNRKRYFWHQNMPRPGLQLSAEWPKESTAMHILHVSMPVATQ